MAFGSGTDESRSSGKRQEFSAVRPPEVWPTGRGRRPYCRSHYSGGAESEGVSSHRRPRGEFLVELDQERTRGGEIVQRDNHRAEDRYPTDARQSHVGHVFAKGV